MMRHIFIWNELILLNRNTRTHLVGLQKLLTSGFEPDASLG